MIIKSQCTVIVVMSVFLRLSVYKYATLQDTSKCFAVANLGIKT